MRFLLINTRYFVSGGPERYMFNLKALLEANGHEVIPFSVAYDRNEPSEYADFFAPPLGGASEVYFRDHSKGVTAYAKTLERAFYSRDVYKRLAALIEKTQPDVALVLHYLRKLSPSVLRCLADNSIPFAVRLSDFMSVCPNAHLVRDGKICELCVGGSLRHSVKYRCVQGSLGASVVNYAATRFHQIAGYYDLIPKFVVPTRFTIGKLIEGGWDRERMVHIPTFVTSAGSGAPVIEDRPPTIAYVGRLEYLKGIHTLLKAIDILQASGSEIPQLSVRIVGTGVDEDYVQSLHDFVAEHGLRGVEFVGGKSRPEIAEILRSARCSVVPSLWYENMPNSALESMAEGTPVVAPNHGCFPELIEDGASGLLVEPGDPRSLADALRRLLQNPDVASAMGARATEVAQRDHSPERHYMLLMSTFADVVSQIRTER
jgi:glycosyltransferase involved in cell wall biosynthesis